MQKKPANKPSFVPKAPQMKTAAFLKEIVPKLIPQVGQDVVVDVETNAGPVRGIAVDGVASFKGVPFAQPPVGPLRFLPPRPVFPWAEKLDCFRFRESSIPAREVIPGISRSEDCLYLNIWAPETAPANAGREKLPVLVFIHGGGFSEGSPAKFMYDGTQFAKGGVVQVNITYRLGALGFMPLAEVRDAYGNTGNTGILDQIMALKWIQNNIECFGGDPDNVTICGESAGAFSVSCLMMSPLAKGLFTRAIMESGNILGQPVLAPSCRGGMHQALFEAQAYTAFLGCRSLASLQRLEPAKIAHGCPFASDVTKIPGYCFWPVFDGYVMPKNPYKALLNGEMNDVDILTGFNSDEGTLFVPPDTNEEKYLRFVAQVFHANALQFVRRFSPSVQNPPAALACKLVETGLRFGSDVFADVLSARGRSVYYYEFDYTLPILEAVGLGAMHALELVFVFDTMPKSMVLTPERALFQRDVHTRWLNFVKTGDPNTGGAVSCPWPKYTPDEKLGVLLKEAPEVMRVPGEADVAFFKELVWEIPNAWLSDKPL